MRLVNIRPQRGTRILIGAIPIVLLLLVYAAVSAVLANCCGVSMK